LALPARKHIDIAYEYQPANVAYENWEQTKPRKTFYGRNSGLMLQFLVHIFHRTKRD
jgi:hypothetical protein